MSAVPTLVPAPRCRPHAETKQVQAVDSECKVPLFVLFPTRVTLVCDPVSAVQRFPRGQNGPLAAKLPPQGSQKEHAQSGPQT